MTYVYVSIQTYTYKIDETYIHICLYVYTYIYKREMTNIYKTDIYDTSIYVSPCVCVYVWMCIDIGKHG